MLKQQVATAVLQRSRITTLATSVPSSPSSTSRTPSPSPSTSSSAPPQRPPQRMSSSEGSVRVAQAPSGPHGGMPRDLKQQKSGPPPVFFPLGYKEAVYQWWTSVAPPMVERNVLSFIPHIKEAADSLGAPATAAAASVMSTDAADPFGTRVWRRSMVKLSGKNRALNEVCVERVGEETEETLVMVHGYGAGLGFFYKNFEPITRTPGLKLYALDMLGMGNSSRPAFKIHASDKDAKIDEAENWFIDALEEWRKARKIERFTLLGHSLGGYMAASYAIKYPGHLKKLILASPVGIPEDPYAVNASLPEPNESTVQNEFTQDQQTATEGGSGSDSPAQVAANGQPAAPRRQMPSWFKWLWDANVSPFSIVRLTGPLGPRFVSGWTSRRFNHLPADEARALHDYSFSIFKQKGSGEYALAYILAPGAYARRPVINRIAQVGRQPLSEAMAAATGVQKETGIPVVFMYGENDWMDVEGGLAAEKKLNEAKMEALKTGTDAEKRAENGSVRVLVVPKAGHHLYLDNPDAFNDELNKEMAKTIKASK